MCMCHGREDEITSDFAAKKEKMVNIRTYLKINRSLLVI